MTEAVSLISIREGMLSAPLAMLDSVRLMGSRCEACRETTLGSNRVCPNCGGAQIAALPLSREGKLWTYTIVRHKPPGDYHGPDPFVPFAMGLVELPEGLRVLAPLEGELAHLKIGMSLRFRAFVRPGSSAPEVVSFAFSATAAGAGQ
jgi:uncharacterized OB-fold protein